MLVQGPTVGRRFFPLGGIRPTNRETVGFQFLSLRQEWDRIVGELTVLGILSRFDRGPLAVYCGAYALWAEATDALHKYGTMIKSPNGYPMPSPYLATLNRQAEVMMRHAADFGFTPAARHRNFSYSKSRSMLLEASSPTTI
jgi:P27 family predicted phage terminase small subunit